MRAEVPVQYADAMVGSMVISADEHVVEAREFWNDWLPQSLPPKDRDRAPRLVGVGIALDSSAHVLRTFTLLDRKSTRLNSSH